MTSPHMKPLTLAVAKDTLCDRVAELLEQRAGSWVNARELMAVGGAFGWRTRLSNLRQRRGMTIENRWRTVSDGERRWRESEYRLLPKVTA